MGRRECTMASYCVSNTDTEKTKWRPGRSQRRTHERGETQRSSYERQPTNKRVPVQTDKAMSKSSNSINRPNRTEQAFSIEAARQVGEHVCVRHTNGKKQIRRTYETQPLDRECNAQTVYWHIKRKDPSLQRCFQTCDKS